MASVKDTGRWNYKARATDMTGQRFGRLVCEERVMSDGSGGARWRCLCDCGRRAVVPRRSLTSGDTRSCGCLRLESSTQRMTTMRERNTSMAKSVGGYYRRMRALADVFPEPPDTVHVDRPGARIVRGSRY